MHPRYQLAPRIDNLEHVPPGGHVWRPPREVIDLFLVRDKQRRRVRVVHEDVLHVDRPERSVSKPVQRSPWLTVRYLSYLGRTSLRGVYHDIRISEIVRERSEQYHVGVQYHDDGILERVLIFLVSRPVCEPVPQSERLIVILVIVAAHSREVRREVHAELGRQFRDDLRVEFGQVVLLFLATPRGDAYDVSGL